MIRRFERVAVAACLALMAAAGPASPRTEASPGALLVGRWQLLPAPALNATPSGVVYDPAHGQLLAFHEIQSRFPQVGTYIFQNGAWHTALGPDSVPGESFFDPAHGVVVALIGACVQTWDGTSWSGESCVPEGSAFFTARAAAYDATRQALIVTGDMKTCRLALCSSVDTQTWTWNGATWTRLSPKHEPGPPLRDMLLNPGGVAVWDPGRHVDVLVDEAGETWTWNGSDWTRLPAVCAVCAASPGVVPPSLTYDPSTGTDVFQDTVSRTERWNGVAWLPVVTTGATAITGPVTVDPTLGGVVMLGQAQLLPTFARLYVLEDGIPAIRP